jgi:dolichyl-phosphate beta-glucosyltransferase
MYLSVIIPAYNEAQRIGGTLRLVLSYLEAQRYEAEVVVVDDGSVDDTQAVAHYAAVNSAIPLRVLRLPQNRGKGAAVRAGMLFAAQGDYRLFYDADGSTPIGMLERVWPCFERGADIVIGSRALPGSDIAVRQAWYREYMGKTNNLLLKLLGLTRFGDTQCGFKAFTAEAAQEVFSRLRCERFAFDAEALVIAQQYYLRIEEIPVRWENSPRTSLHPLRDSSRMLLDALHIWRRLHRNRY